MYEMKRQIIKSHKQAAMDRANILSAPMKMGAISRIVSQRPLLISKKSLSSVFEHATTTPVWIKPANLPELVLANASVDDVMPPPASPIAEEYMSAVPTTPPRAPVQPVVVPGAPRRARRIGYASTADLDDMVDIAEMLHEVKLTR
jgi:hypothetical protein